MLVNSIPDKHNLIRDVGYMVIRFFWPNCTFRGKEWDAAPIDAFWVEAKLGEAKKSVFPLLSPEAIAESKELAKRYARVARDMANPPRPYCFLVARDLSTIDPFHVNYPVHPMWNAYSPFGEFQEHRISKLDELKTFALPDKIDWVGIQDQKTEEMTNSGSDSVLTAYDTWRSHHKEGLGWGLALYLANEICQRFYSSHGIVPHVIEHEGRGYYGIQLDRVSCQVNGENNPTIGRLTAAGNVENWITGGAGDHGLELVERAKRGEPVEPMVEEAIQYLRLSAYPLKSHLNCRHKRWGASYSFIFHIASLLALRNDEYIEIWNHPYHTDRIAKELDSKSDQKEHMGYFIFFNRKTERQVILAGDGRLLMPQRGESYWERYMRGESVIRLTESIEGLLCLP